MNQPYTIDKARSGINTDAILLLPERQRKKSSIVT